MGIKKTNPMGKVNSGEKKETKAREAVMGATKNSAASVKKLLYLVTFIVGFIGFLGSIADILNFLGYDSAKSIASSPDSKQTKVASSVNPLKNPAKENKNREANKKDKNEKKKQAQDSSIRYVGSLEVTPKETKRYINKVTYKKKRSKTRLKIGDWRFTGTSNTITMQLSGRVYGSRVKEVKVTYYSRGRRYGRSDVKDVSNGSRFMFSKTFWKNNNISKVKIEVLDGNGKRLKQSSKDVIISKY